MATLMRSSNPALNEKAFKGQVTFGEAMTLQGTVNKTGFLLLCVVAAAAWTWGLAHSPAPEAAVPWMMGGIFGGLIVALPSFILLFIARFHLGRSFSVTPQARKLVTTGLYLKIRNPMYVFSFLLVFGFLLALQKPYLLLLLLVLLPIQIMRAHQEARVLEQKFGDAYRRYKARVPRYFAGN